MTDQFLGLLRCPFCGAPVGPSKIVAESKNEIEWGIIKCSGCEAKFPVAFGIPIIKPLNSYVDSNEIDIVDSSFHKGTLVHEIIDCIEEGKIEKVKKELILFRFPRATKKGIRKQDGSYNINNKLERLLPNTLVRAIGKQNVQYLYWVLSKLSLQDRRYRKRETIIFEKLKNASSASDFIYYYFRELMFSPIYDYFEYRYGQPRYLVVLSLLTTLPDDDKPILDIACGTGHLFHYLTHRNTSQSVIGVERNFAKLYLAKKFIAPKGNYFCAEAEQPLPFENDVFSSVYSSDAFQYFKYRPSSVREMKRVLSPDGVIFISRVSSMPMKYYKGNAIIPPKQLKSYFQEMPNVVFDQEEVLGRYIRKYGPALSSEPSMSDLNKSEWISIVASNRKDYFRDYGEFKNWPHALGNLKLNPLYHENGKDESGNRILKFRFPSEWYEYEDHDWRKYAPETVRISHSTLEAIEKGTRTPEIDDLISKWVIIGMPEKYLPSDSDSE